MKLTSLFADYLEIRYDELNPDIRFLGSPWKKTITTEGGNICWEEIGIEIVIPEGAIPEKEILELQVRPCLSGPFVLPDDYELVSPIFMISPAFEFQKEVTLTLAHYVDLKEPADCQEMSFLESKSISQDEIFETKYKFSLLEGGVFKPYYTRGTILLKHFSKYGTGRRKRKRSDSPTSSHGSPAKKGKGKVCIQFLL